MHVISLFPEDKPVGLKVEWVISISCSEMWQVGITFSH